MSEQKRYTAQEMREIEQLINSDDSDKDLFVCNNTKSRFEMEHIFDYNEETTLKVKAMLSQAADTEEELERALKNEKALELRVDYWRSQHNALKARLEEVVKEIEGRDWINDGDLADSILRIARGEGGAE